MMICADLDSFPEKCISDAVLVSIPFVASTEVEQLA